MSKLQENVDQELKNCFTLFKFSLSFYNLLAQHRGQWLTFSASKQTCSLRSLITYIDSTFTCSKALNAVTSIFSKICISRLLYFNSLNVDEIVFRASTLEVDIRLLILKSASQAYVE